MDYLPASSAMPGFTENINFLIKNYISSCNIDCKGFVQKEEDYLDLKNELNCEEVELYCAGSSFERLSLPDTHLFSGEIHPHLQYSNLQKLSDMDLVFLNRTKTVCIQKEPNSDSYFAQIDSSNCYPGYCRLLLLNVGKDEVIFYSADLFKKTSAQKEYIHKIYDIVKGRTPLNLNEPEVEVKSFTEQALTHGPALTITVTDSLSEIGKEVDIVVAVPCPDWPSEAHEWVSRPRQFNWPSQSTIDKIISDGCYLVPVGHSKSTTKELEWRFSFTKAEKRLALSLLDTQRHCYLLLKMIFYYHLKHLGCLSSYHMKTVLFWTCEQTPGSMWKQEKAGECFLHLLNNLFQFISLAKIPNYFIPNNNMIEGIQEEHLRTITKTLADIKREPWKFLLPLQELYNPNLKKQYDFCQVILDGMGFKTFEARNHYTKPKQLLNQIYEPVIENIHTATASRDDRILSLMKQAMILVVTKAMNHVVLQECSDTSTLQSFLEALALMQDQGYLPETWSDDDSNVFILHLLIIGIHVVPEHLMKFLANDASYFLKHIKGHFGVLNSNTNPFIFCDSLYLDLLRWSLKEENMSKDACEQDVLHKDLGEDLFSSNIAVDNKSVMKGVYGALFALKKYDDRSSNLWEEMMSSSLKNCQIHLITPSYYFSSLHENGLTYEKSDQIKSLKELAKHIHCSCTWLSGTLQIFIDRHTCESALFNVCESFGGKITLSLEMLCIYGLSVCGKDVISFVPDSLSSLDSACLPPWVNLCTEAVCKRHDYSSVNKLIDCVGVVSPRLNILRMLCPERMEAQGSNSCEGQVKELLNVFDGLDMKSIGVTREENEKYGLSEEISIMDILSSLCPDDLIDVSNFFLKLEEPTESELLIGLCLGRVLYANACQQHLDRSDLLSLAEKVIQKAVQMSGGNPVFTAYYLNYFLKEDRHLELCVGLEILNRKDDLCDFLDKPLMLHKAENATLPVHFHHPLISAKYISISLQAFLKSLTALCLKPDDSIEPVLTDKVYTSKLSPHWMHMLEQSMLHEVNGVVYNKIGAIQNARDSFISCLKMYPGTHDRLYKNIRKCEESIMRQSMEKILREDFEEAYSLYSQCWETGLPRCQSSCSKVLHLSQELLLMSAADDRALRLSTMFLQHAVLKEQDLHMPVDHKSHILCNLACLYHNISSSDPICEDNFRSSVACLETAIELSRAGTVHAMLGNLLYTERRFSDALGSLDKAIEKGKAALPLHDFHDKQAIHDLVTETRKYHLLNFIPADRLFVLMTCSYKDHYDSYLLYALYLRARCQLFLGIDASLCLKEVEYLCEQEIGSCTLKWGVLGLLYLLNGLYKQAEKYFSKEIKGDGNDIFKQNVFIHQLKTLSECALILEAHDGNFAQQMVDGWFYKLESVECSETLVSQYKYQSYKPSVPLSLAVYMSNELSQLFCDLPQNEADVIVKVYQHLHRELKEEDEMADGLLTQIALILLDKYSHLAESGKTDSSLISKIDSTFQRALASDDVHLTITRVGYGQFLLKEHRYNDCIEQANVCQTLALEKLSKIVQLLQDTSVTEDECLAQTRQMKYFVDKALIPSSDLLILCYSLQQNFSAAFDVVDTVLASLLRVNQVDLDPLAFLIKFTLDLSSYGADIETVIRFHEAIIKRYPDSQFIATIHGNLACMLFSRAMESKQEDYDLYKGLILKCKDCFQKAIRSTGASMATYADYANFLYNTGDSEEALLVICQSDDLHDKATGCNAYSREEGLCVDDCLRQIIDSHGKVKISSHIYCQYLRVCVFIDLKRESDLIASELLILKELIKAYGDDDDDDIFQTMYSYLCSKEAGGVSKS